jgi:gas vesicle protein
MNDRDKTDLWTALAVGAVVGIGAALLLRSSDQPETRRLLRTLRPVQERARRAVKNASRQLEQRAQELGSRGEDLVDQGTDALADLRRDAAEIVGQAREELEQIARKSLKQVRMTARRARRHLA